MTDIEWDELGPKRRERDLEWLSKRISWLSWHLTRAHWARMPAGSHHMFSEVMMFVPPYPLPQLETRDGYIDFSKKVSRLVRLAKLHNRYLDQSCKIQGLIIN